MGIEDLELRYFGGANDGVAILLRDCMSCRVRRRRIHEVRRAGIWVEGGEGIRIEDNEKVNPLHWDGDANNLYTTSGLPLFQWHGMSYSDIAAFRSATGQERQGFSAPQFINAPRGDFTPGAGSPLIDRGVRIAGVNDRFAGREPDVGAIERQNER